MFLVLMKLLLILLQFEAIFCNFTCGLKHESSELIIGRSHSGKGQWPWIAAMVYAKDQKYFCGATLITSKHLVTAAHCIEAKKSKTSLKPNEIIVLLGVHDIFKRNEIGSNARFVSKIILHPDWKSEDPRYDANIAVIFLRNEVKFSNTIEPICLPTPRATMSLDDGVIVSSQSIKS